MFLGLAMALFQANLLASSYVLFRTYMRWRRRRQADAGEKHGDSTSLSMAHRMPLYLACTDLLLYAVFSLNVGYSLTHGHTLAVSSLATCKVVSAITFYLLTMTGSLVSTVAVLSWLRIVQGRYIDVGTRDHRLLGTIAAVSCVPTLLALPSFGADTMWCFAEPSSLYLPVTAIAMHILGLILCAYCYTQTLTIVNHVQTESKTEHDTPQEFPLWIERRATRKVISYVLVYLLQLLPAYPYFICVALGRSEWWAWILMVVSLQIGGLGNALRYWWDESVCEGEDVESAAGTIRGLGGPHKSTSGLCEPNMGRRPSAWSCYTDNPSEDYVMVLPQAPPQALPAGMIIKRDGRRTSVQMRPIYDFTANGYPGATPPPSCATSIRRLSTCSTVVGSPSRCSTPTPKFPSSAVHTPQRRSSIPDASLSAVGVGPESAPAPEREVDGDSSSDDESDSDYEYDIPSRCPTKPAPLRVAATGIAMPTPRTVPLPPHLLNPPVRRHSDNLEYELNRFHQLRNKNLAKVAAEKNARRVSAPPVGAGVGTSSGHKRSVSAGSPLARLNVNYLAPWWEEDE